MMQNDELLNLLNNELDNANDFKSISNAFEKITINLNKSCNALYSAIFDYKFSNYLYYHYILHNKTKMEISKMLNIAPSTLYYYIKKYNLKKDRKLINANIVESLKITCNEKYNVNHPGELPEVHKKRIKNIYNKTNGNYNKTYYAKLNRSIETKEKMKIAQQQRRYNEKKVTK